MVEKPRNFESGEEGGGEGQEESPPALGSNFSNMDLRNSEFSESERKAEEERLVKRYEDTHLRGSEAGEPEQETVGNSPDHERENNPPIPEDTPEEEESNSPQKDSLENLRAKTEKIRQEVEAGDESKRWILEEMERGIGYVGKYRTDEKKRKFGEGLDKLKAAKDRQALGNDVVRLRREFNDARRQEDLENAKRIHAELGDTQDALSIHELEERIKALNEKIRQGVGASRTQAEEFADQTALADAERKLFKLLYHRDGKKGEDSTEREVSSQPPHTPDESSEEQEVIEPEILAKEETEGDITEPKDEVIDVHAEDVSDGAEQETPSGVEGQKRIRWEDMTEEERREKYGRTFEIREKLHQFNDARAKLVVAEHKLSIKDREIISRAMEDDSEAELSGSQQEYIDALENYGQARSGYVGAKAWRVMKESRRLAEEKSHEHESGVFERVRKGWRWLGEQNLDKFLTSKGVEIEGKWKKFGARMVSLRTTAGLGLLAGGAAIGFGSAVGITALAARRAMGGIGFSFSSYDLMRNAHEKKTLSVDISNLDEMSIEDLEQNMASFEGSAKYSGERVVKSDEYNALRREYAGRLKNDEAKSLTETMQTLDETLREKQLGLARKERNRKITAMGIGALGIGAFSHSEISSFAEKKAEELSSMGADFVAGTKGAVQKGLDAISGETLNEIIASAKEVVEEAGVTAQRYIQFIQTGIMVTEEQLEEAVQEEVKLPEEIISAGDKVVADVDVSVTPEADTGVDAVQEVVTQKETVEAIAETIKKGGSVWNAAQRLVENGSITKEQFAESWSSPASSIKLPSGETIHISELGLSHAGDQVIHIPATEDVPAHFDVVDYTKDTLHVGNNEDLAKAFEAKGMKNPEWLEESLKAKEDAVQLPQDASGEAVDTADVGAADGGELSQKEVNISSAEKVPESSIEVVDVPTKFEWGRAEFIMNSDGSIADIRVEEKLTPMMRVKFIEGAANELLNPDFRGTVEWNTNMIAKAKQSAWEIKRLQQILGSIADKDSSEAHFLMGKIEAIIKNGESSLGKIFKPNIIQK